VASFVVSVGSHSGELRREETLLIEGPASLRILSGEGTVFGAIIEEGDEILVRKGKRLPLTPCSNRLNYEAKVGGNLMRIEGDAIPMSWKAAADAMASAKGRAVVLGGVDTGKTGFCTYLVNRAVLSSASVGYVDGDIGQPETGPPTTITAIMANEQSYLLERFRASSMYFVGHTSPTFCQERVVDSIERCVHDLEGKGAGLVVVNTDGWIKEGGLRHKAALMERLRADTIVSLLLPGEELILSGEMAEPRRFVRISRPDNVKSRSQDERRENREHGYRTYFRDARRRRIGIDGVRLVNSPLRYVGKPERAELDKLSGETGLRVVYYEDAPKVLVAIEPGVERGHLGGFDVLRFGWERGVIVGLMGGKGALGLGIVLDIDYGGRTMELLCPAEITQMPDAIEFGNIRLGEDFRESYCALGRSMDG